MKEQSETKKKSSRRKYIIAGTIIMICVIAGYAYMIATWSPVNAESIKISEATIRKFAAAQLFKDPNELTDEDFAKIEVLGMGGMELSDINLLEKFTNLQSLNLLMNSFPKKELPTWMRIFSKTGLYDPYEKYSLDLSPLENLSNLDELLLGGPMIKDIEPISGLSNLDHLILTNTQVSDYEPLKQMTNLRLLQLNDLSITDLEPLRNLTNLNSLYLFKIPVSDLEPLKNLTNLRLLTIKDIPVTSLEPLRNLTYMQYLLLNDLEVSDIEPLKKFYNLQQLDIKGCINVSDQQVDELQKALPNLEILR